MQITLRFQPNRMGKIKIWSRIQTRIWWTWSHVHCWWECEVVQSLWKSLWSFLKKLDQIHHMISLYHPWASTQRTQYPTVEITSPSCLLVLHSKARWSSTDVWMLKMLYIYPKEYYSCVINEMMKIGVKVGNNHSEWVTWELKRQMSHAVYNLLMIAGIYVFCWESP